jgi:hypothetical protein
MEAAGQRTAFGFLKSPLKRSLNGAPYKVGKLSRRVIQVTWNNFQPRDRVALRANR